jgi:hypothetical protein
MPYQDIFILIFTLVPVFNINTNILVIGTMSLIIVFIHFKNFPFSQKI